MTTIKDLLSNPDIKHKFVMEKLIMTYIGISRDEMRIQIDQEIPQDLLEKIQTGYDAYAKNNKPLEYILGYVTFYNRDFHVTSDTLIPRPETEYMIEAASEFLAYYKEKNADPLTIVDVGTGCGVLGISTFLSNPSAVSHAYLVDISAPALVIAQENWERLVPEDMQDRVTFAQGNLLEPVLGPLEKGRATVMSLQDGVVLGLANLPYIQDKTFDENVAANVKDREPRVAFVGGDDGLDLYRIMFEQRVNSPMIPSDSVFFCEMMTWQVEILRQEWGTKFHFEEVKTFHFTIRIVKVSRKNEL